MKNLTHKIFAIAALALCTVVAKAQNEPIIAHYMYHAQVFNPAVVGNTNDIHISLLARQQWVGFKEAPSTQLLDAYGYIAKIRSGVGLVVIHDMLGKERSVSARVSYAYAQRLGDKARLSFGLSVGLLSRSVRGGELIYQEDADQSGIYNNATKLKPYLGLGLEFSGYNTTLGFSITHLDQSQGNSTVFKIPRHYMAYAKYSWDVNEKFNLTPGVFVRSSVYTTQAEININATFRKRIVAGLIYRTTNAAGALLGVHIWKGLFASYSYDFDFGTLRSYQTGSHEVNISYRIPGKKEKRPYYKSPRYMN